MDFYETIAARNFCVLDTETTGLKDAEICQIAIIDHTGEVLFNTLVKPVKPIPSDAVRVHGITNEQVQNAPSWAEVAPKVVDILRGKDLVIYNAGYDVPTMHSASKAVGIKLEESWTSVHCAMLTFAKFYGDWDDYHESYRWKKLDFAAHHLGVKVENAHDALGDCLMTLAVCFELLDSQKER